MLARSKATGHGDGISVYTGELLKSFAADPACRGVVQVVFGSALANAIPTAHAMPLSYPPAAVLAAATHLPFPGSNALQAGIDLFHATDHHIPRLGRTPVIATLMDVIGLRHPEWLNPRLRTLKNLLLRKTTTWAERYITISDFSADDISDCLSIPREKIVSIPLGVDEQFFSPVPSQTREAVIESYGLRPGYFLFVGTLQPRKNVRRVVQAHASLPVEIRLRHPLVIVGQNGWRTDDLLPALSAMESEGRGRWLKYVARNELFSLLQSARALVFPSLYEGFGLPVLEAFASRIPVVTSNTTSLPEVAGNAALLVDPLSVDAIAHAMSQLASDQLLCDSLIDAGVRRAREFTWQQTARKTWAVYERFMR